MKEHEAFLRQARSDWEVFKLLLTQDRDLIPSCHPLHYLQMATEKLAKAAAIASGITDFDKYSHVAFSLLPAQLSRGDVARKLGWSSLRAFQQFLRRAAPIFREVDELNPSVGMRQPGGGPKDGPNSEYPWRGRDVDGAPLWHVPADYPFRLIEKLRSGDAAQVLQFVASLIDRFEAVFQ